MIEFLLEYRDLIITLASIGTFISSLIAIFTLVEVKKQRLSMYKPDILIKSFIVSISKSPFLIDKTELIEYKVSDFNDYSTNYSKIDFETFPKYKLENLGMGVAKNLKCEWKYNTQKAIKMINGVIPPQYSFSFHNNLNMYVLNDSNDENFHFSFNANITEQTVDYISPINIQKHFHYHSIPKIIVLTHYLFLLFKNRLTNEKGENFHIIEFNEYKFPQPILKTEYRDLNGKIYKQNFKFEVAAINIQIDDILDLTKEFAYLNFELRN